MFSFFADSLKSIAKSISIDNIMASNTSIQFIESALFCTTSFALSYTDPDQKWLIREHFISLVQDFPCLTPSMGIFTHNDGTQVNLLNANGELPVSSSAPPVPITIWIHELYPHMAPIVYVSTSSLYPMYDKHPFVDSSSGLTTSSYLKKWHFSKSNLSSLVQSLVKVFSHNHPFYYSGSTSCDHPFLLSKTEAMDRLVCTLYYDMAALGSNTGEEIDRLSALQARMAERAYIVECLLRGLECERAELKERVNLLADEADKLLNWLKVYERNCIVGMVGDDIDHGFEALDLNSEVVLDCLAADKALEDLIYALDKAVEKGAISFQVYIKQVRILAREQFMHKAKLLKIEKVQ